MSNRRAVMAAAGIALVAPAFPGPAENVTPAAANARSERVERAVISRVNRLRERHGVRTLRPSEGLAQAAEDHSDAILRFDFLSHSSPDGTPMETRVRRYVSARTVGETIAWVPRSGSVRAEARRVMRLWRTSASHRSALLDRRFRRVGVGRERGRLGGRGAAVTTLDLASAR